MCKPLLEGYLQSECFGYSENILKKLKKFGYGQNIYVYLRKFLVYIKQLR